MNETNETPKSYPEDDALDRALAAALPTPSLPAGFAASLHTARAAEAALDLARQRHRLEEEYERDLAALRSGYVRMRRDTLATVLGIAFAAGAVVAWGVPWLRATYGIDLSTLLPLLVLAAGLGAGATAWVERFGWPRWARR